MHEFSWRAGAEDAQLSASGLRIRPFEVSVMQAVRPQRRRSSLAVVISAIAGCCLVAVVIVLTAVATNGGGTGVQAAVALLGGKAAIKDGGMAVAADGNAGPADKEGGEDDGWGGVRKPAVWVSLPVLPPLSVDSPAKTQAEVKSEASGSAPK